MNTHNISGVILRQIFMGLAEPNRTIWNCSLASQKALGIAYGAVCNSILLKPHVNQIFSTFLNKKKWSTDCKIKLHHNSASFKVQIFS